MSTNIKSVIWVLYFSFWPCQIPGNFALSLCGCCGPATEPPSSSLPWLLITYSPNWPLKGQIIAGSSAQLALPRSPAQVSCPGVLMARSSVLARIREGRSQGGGEGRAGEGRGGEGRSWDSESLETFDLLFALLFFIFSWLFIIIILSWFTSSSLTCL